MSLKRTVPVLVLASVLAMGAACTHCGGDDVANGDAGDAASDRRKDGPFDGAGDGGDEPDADETWLWPGWKRAPWFPSYCRVAIPVDVTKDVTPLSWKACANGLADCLERLPPAKTGNGTGGFRTVRSAPIEKGKVFFQEIVSLGDSKVHVAIIDIDANQVVAAWRSVGSAGCYATGYAAVGGFSLDLGLPSNQRYYDFGDPARVMTAPAPVESPKALQGKPAEITSLMASTTTVAARHVGPLVSRWTYGQSTYVTTLPNVLLNGFPVVVDKAVFAESEYGAAGWQEVYRVNADGSITLLRGQQGRHVTGFSTDGVTMSWIEAHGNPSPTNLTQPIIEVWSAPFSDDPTAIATTATKVATLPSQQVAAGVTTTTGDYITTRHGIVGGGVIHVARRSDGHIKLVSPGANRFFLEAAYVQNNELVATVNGDQPGQDGIALVRIQLGAW